MDLFLDFTWGSASWSSSRSILATVFLGCSWAAPSNGLWIFTSFIAPKPPSRRVDLASRVHSLALSGVNIVGYLAISHQAVWLRTPHQTASCRRDVKLRIVTRTPSCHGHLRQSWISACPSGSAAMDSCQPLAKLPSYYCHLLNIVPLFTSSARASAI